MDFVFQSAGERILRLDIPFDHLYTSVFLIEDNTPLIIDTATTKGDVHTYILPALKSLGIDKAALLVTHRHGDHNGGTPYLLEALPQVKRRTLRDGESLGAITAIALGGHTEDSMGYFDTRSKTLLSGDALQFFGVGKYGCSIVDAALYERTLSRVRTLSPLSILPSHDFVGGAAAAHGEAAVNALLDAAVSAWEDVKAFVYEAKKTDPDPASISRRWKETRPELPPLPSITVKSVLANI